MRIIRMQRRDGSAAKNDVERGEADVVLKRAALGELPGVAENGFHERGHVERGVLAHGLLQPLGAVEFAIGIARLGQPLEF